jgi:hypothetical protein
MDKSFLKKVAATITGLLLMSATGFSQLVNVDFLRSAPEDGVKFIEAYISPWANALGAGMNGSWYNTAKPHKLLGFDVTLGLNVGMVPAAAKSFDLTSIGLSDNLSVTGSSTVAPTAAGGLGKGPEMTYSVTQSGFPTVNVATFNTPPGTNLGFIPAPTAQIGLGLPLGTEVKVRYMPTLDIRDGDIGLWGVGLMHSIMQYIPGNKLLPVDVSLFGGYTELTVNVPLNLQPDDAFTSSYTTYNATTDFNDQNLGITVSAMNVSAIASVNLPIISFYGGLGYSQTQFKAVMTGNFPLPGVEAGGVVYNDAGVKTGADFPEINIENFSGLRANVGFRLKFAVITIHADYTKAQYNVFSTGLGVSFR